MNEGEHFLETCMVIGIWAGILFGGYRGVKNALEAETSYDKTWEKIARIGFFGFGGVSCGVFLGMMLPVWMFLTCIGMVVGAVALAIHGARLAWRYCVDRKQVQA